MKIALASALPAAFMAAALTLAVEACSTPDTTARVDPIGPDRASFEPVARVLVRLCGTLDCHGTPDRNLRLYGYGGLRLDPDAGPDIEDIQPAEVEADYQAVIGVEPEKMREVVQDKGRDPERLTLVRKARGAEDHKGLNPIIVGDDADMCLTSWLASAVDTAACIRVLPPGSPGAAKDAGTTEAGSP